MSRRDYGEGSVYQRCELRYGCPPVKDVGTDETGRVVHARPPHKCRARWYGVVEAGWTKGLTRRRLTVSAKTKTEALRRLREKRRQYEAGEIARSDRMTVKAWAETYLELRKEDLKPNAWNAAASPIRKWVVPTIGHRRLATLTPNDVREVDQAQYDAGRKTATADATRRAMVTMLNWALAEGYVVPQRVFKVPKPGPGNSDRTDLSVEETVACLEVAAQLPHGVRWVLALLYGARQNEVLGLTRDCLDFDAKIIRLEWQLEALPYEHGCKAGPNGCSAPRPAGCPSRRFRVPRDFEARRLVDAWHLTRPKSRKGMRVLAMIPPIEDALRRWLAIAPPNPHDLVFASLAGRPVNDKVDREEWWGIQGTAGVGHPAGRYYHVHECRNFAATRLDEVGAQENVITSMLGHASILTSRGYMTEHVEPKRRATAAVAELLGAALLELAGPTPAPGGGADPDGVVLGLERASA
jgi:integrase